MTKCILKISLAFFMVIFCKTTIAQATKSADFYLLENIEVNNLSKKDKQLLDSLLTLYHSSEIDTLQFSYLSYFIENSSDDNLWSSYNKFLMNRLEKKIKLQTNKQLKNKYLWFYAGTLNNNAVYYQQIGTIPKAIENYNKSLKIYESIGDKAGVGNVLNNLCVIHNNQGEVDISLVYYERVLKLQEEANNKIGVAKALNNIGYIYGQMKEIEKAIDYYEKSLKIREEINDKEGVAVSLNNIGSIYAREENPKKTIDYFKKSYQIFEELNNKEGMVYAMSNIGAAQLALNYYKDAENSGLKAFKIASETGFPELVKRSSFFLSDVYKKQNKWKEAMSFYEVFITMRDSIINSENAKEAVKQQLTYEYEKQKLEAKKEQEKKDVMNTKEKERQQQTTLFVVLVLIVVVIFTIFLFNRFRVIRKQKKIIEQKQKEILDSIRYAKRIQEAILTSQIYIERNIKRLKKMTND